MDETASINDQLQKIVKDQLQKIKQEEGYDFIFNYADGGAILIADEQYDITEQVLNALNTSGVKGDAGYERGGITQSGNVTHDTAIFSLILLRRFFIPAMFAAPQKE